jgi:hypothetical protein
MVPRDKKSELLQKLERQNIKHMYRIKDMCNQINMDGI